MWKLLESISLNYRSEKKELTSLVNETKEKIVDFELQKTKKRYKQTYFVGKAATFSFFPSNDGGFNDIIIHSCSWFFRNLEN